MIRGDRIVLRPIQDGDWAKFEAWGKRREALWGAYQRFQLDHVPLLREAYERTGLLGRESGMLLVETLDDQEVVGYVRYTLLRLPDADVPYPEIGYGIPEAQAQGKGYATEGVRLLVQYLFMGYPVERIVAFTEEGNRASQRVLEKVGFQQEGLLRRATFRDGQWRNMAIYGILRDEFRAGH